MKLNNSFVASLLLMFFAFFQTPSIGSAEETVRVEIVGEGIAPVKTTVSVAKRVALILAKRDAIEKGLGASVSVKMIPNIREVRSDLEGTLSYDILSEGEKDGAYFVYIRSFVEIPSELIEKYSLTEDDREVYTGLKPLVEEFPNGTINWQDGFLISYGVGEWPSDKEGKEAELLARRAAVIDAQANALEMINGIRVDAEEQLKGLLSKDKELFYRIEGIVRSASIESEEANRPYRVNIKVPLTGIKGLGVEIYSKVVKKKKVMPGRGSDKADEGITGIVIDARGTGLRTALFPMVLDNTGRQIYSVEMVDEASFIKRGVVGYTTGVPETNTERVGLNPLYINAISTEYALLASSDETFMPSGGPLVAENHENKKRRKRRQGNNPLKVKGVRSDGPLKANVVISGSDAKKIESDKDLSKLFKESRVIIITDSSIGGTEGSIDSPLNPLIAHYERLR
ncbi:MAG: hypothetical protein JSV21_09985 [Nitrospirota bacterium]|nr:MAG: hypothetical protein JSV21_09985 [Nitrospirota bacterium]